MRGVFFFSLFSFVVVVVGSIFSVFLTKTRYEYELLKMKLLLKVTMMRARFFFQRRRL